MVESSEQQSSIHAVGAVAADGLDRFVAADLASLELAEESEIGLGASAIACLCDNVFGDLVKSDKVFVLAVCSERQLLESLVVGLGLEKLELLGGLRSRAEVAEKGGDLGYLILVFHIHYF